MSIVDEGKVLQKRNQKRNALKKANEAASKLRAEQGLGRPLSNERMKLDALVMQLRAGEFYSWDRLEAMSGVVLAAKVKDGHSYRTQEVITNRSKFSRAAKIAGVLYDARSDGLGIQLVNAENGVSFVGNKVRQAASGVQTADRVQKQVAEQFYSGMSPEDQEKLKIVANAFDSLRDLARDVLLRFAKRLEK